MKEVYPRAISLAAEQRVDLAPLLTHRFPLEKAPEAFGAAAQRIGLKVIIEPGSGAGWPAGSR